MQEELSTQRTDETRPDRPRRKLVMRAILPGDEELIRLSAPRLSLGRSSDCDVRLERTGVSRRHAELERRGPALSIRDAGSTNGTYVDGKRVDHTSLRAGQVVRLGEWLGIVEEHASDHARAYAELAPGLWGGSLLADALRPVLGAAASDVPVVLLGRTGSGKELFARALHWHGRRGRPFHAINCAALPANLAEAELFGYRRGAFSGAERNHDGHLRAASGGTLFLDEIADLPLALQAKLLRAVETGEVTPLGETAPQRFEARIVAACQVPLAELVTKGKFREDLAARLNGLVVRLPDLSERRGDVPALFDTFMRRYAGGTEPEVSTRFYEELCLYPWPGNVRELELLARRMLALHGLEPVLRRSHLEQTLRATERESPGQTKQERAQDVEALTSALQHAAGNVKKAAEMAGISRQRAYRIINSRRLSGVVSASRQGGDGEDERHH